MVLLNLPAFDYKTKDEKGRTLIFDIIRKKYVVLSPEEWVRQHLVHYLINSLSYSKSLIKVETGLRYNRLSKRSDILIYNRSADPFMIIECKSPDIKITQSVFEQAALYNKSIRANYLAISNGLAHFCCKINHQTGSYIFVKTFPAFQKIQINSENSPQS